MTDKNFLWVISGLLTVGLTVAIHHKGVGPFKPKSPKIERPLEEDWAPPPAQPVTPVPPPVVVKSYKDAIDQCGKSNKPLLLFFTSKSCSPCQKMKTELAPGLSGISSQLIYYEVDVQTEPDVVKTYNITVTPTYMVINCQEQVLKTGTGYKDAKAFGEWLAAPYNPPLDPPGKKKDDSGKGQVKPKERNTLPRQQG